MESCKRMSAITFLVGVLVLVLLQSGYCSAVVHMRIDNAVGPAMDVHCYATDGTEDASDTIGGGEYWLFSIKPKTQGVRYKCRFRWAGEEHNLTIYDESRGIQLSKYHWSVNEDGGCLLMDSVGTWQCYSFQE